ncbi:MAG TPA: hypothetical protein VGO25_15080, partial [Rhodanobacteraceae bacterium]|nr:hypothetical protein [Rhodanobacteraceae bacterium]
IAPFADTARMSNPQIQSLRQSLSAGVRRHAVALISLAVALFGTSYNTWRNQTTEAHRNTRAAAFMVLDALGQLQEITDRRFYGGDHSDANRIGGWGKVNVVRDMAPLISHDAEARAADLFKTWTEDVDELEKGNDRAQTQVSEAIVALRKRILVELQALN